MATGTIDELTIKIDSDIKDALSGIRKVDSAVGRMDKSVGKAASSIRKATGKMVKSFAAVGFAVAAMGAVVSTVLLKSAAEEENVSRLTEGLLKSQGESWDELGVSVDTYLKKLERLTGYNDTDLQVSFNSLLSMGMDYQSALKAMTSVTDLAFSKNMDLESSAKLIGKAFVGETGELKRYGIILDDSLDASEKFAGLTDFISTNLTSATARTDTFTGKLNVLKNSLLNIGEAKMDKLLDPLSGIIQRIIDQLPTLESYVTTAFETMRTTITELAPTWDNLSSIMDSAKGIFLDIFNAITGGSSDMSTFTNAVNTLTGALSSVFAWIDKHPGITKLAVTIGLAAAAFAYIVPIVTTVVGVVGGLISFVSALALAIGGATSVMGAISAVIAVLGGPITVVIGLVALLAAAWTTNFFGIRDITSKVVDTIKSLFMGMVNFLGPLVADWINNYIKLFNLLVPFLNKAGLDMNKIAEVQFTRLEKTVADTATSIEGSAQDISGAMEQVETDIEQSTTGAMDAYTKMSDVAATTSEELTMSMVKAGVTRSDLAKRAEDIASGLITPSAMVKNIPGPLGTEPALKIVDEQKETNLKLDKLDKLDKLSEISTKLDKLKIEVNNYVTNNTTSRSTSRSSGGGGLVVSTKATQGVSTALAKKLADPLGYSSRLY